MPVHQVCSCIPAEILSPSTESKDRTAKRDLCEQQGLRFCLLIEPQKICVLALVE